MNGNALEVDGCLRLWPPSVVVSSAEIDVCKTITRLCLIIPRVKKEESEYQNDHILASSTCQTVVTLFNR